MFGASGPVRAALHAKGGDATVVITTSSSVSAETYTLATPTWIQHDAAESILKPMPPSNREEGRGIGNTPSVLQRLCKQDFFGQCKSHSHLRNGVLNFFVLDEQHDGKRACCRHSDLVQGGEASSLIQVRRYMHRNVVLVEDIVKHYDTRGIQMYYINQKRAILLQPKETSASNPVYDNCCTGCKVPLRPDCIFCSLACSIDAPDRVHAARLVITPKKRSRQPSGGARHTGGVRPPPKLRSLRPGGRAWSRKPEYPLRSPE